MKRVSKHLMVCKYVWMILSVPYSVKKKLAHGFGDLSDSHVECYLLISYPLHLKINILHEYYCIALGICIIMGRNCCTSLDICTKRKPGICSGSIML